MRVIIDTNVLMSALLKENSSPAHVVSLWRTGEIDLVLSPEIIDEITRVLTYGRISKHITPEKGARYIKLLQEEAIILTPREKVTAVSNDPDDNKFLALALICDAAYIISGDHHLLDLKAYQGIPIVTPRAFLDRFKST